MARETKLGMLVGLGFIICFAIILENRGRTERVVPQMPHQILSQARIDPQAGDSSAVQAKVRRYAEGINRRAQPVAGGVQQVSERRPVETVVEQPLARSHSLEPAGPMGDAQTTMAQLTAKQSNSSESGQAGVQEPAITVVESKPEPAVEMPATNVEIRIAGHYTVKTGDTLSRIASRQYGSSAKRVIDAIFDANRATMSSPNDLRSGATIDLPAIDGLEPGDGQVTRGNPPQKTEVVENQPQYRWYQIRKGDRYSTIAQKQLGSAGRWKELAELNRDIFPDPAKIRFGVRIRIPMNAVGTRSPS